MTALISIFMIIFLVVLTIVLLELSFRSKFWLAMLILVQTETIWMICFLSIISK